MGAGEMKKIKAVLSKMGKGSKGTKKAVQKFKKDFNKEFKIAEKARLKEGKSRVKVNTADKALVAAKALVMKLRAVGDIRKWKMRKTKAKAALARANKQAEADSRREANAKMKYRTAQLRGVDATKLERTATTSLQRSFGQAQTKKRAAIRSTRRTARARAKAKAFFAHAKVRLARADGEV